MENNQGNSNQPATGCIKVVAAAIIVVVALWIIGNLPFLLNCALVLIFGIMGLAIIVLGFYGICKLIQKIGGNSNVKS